MQLQTLCVGALGVNTYILSDDAHALVIDPGAGYETIKAMLGKPCTHVLLTHAHFDHIGAVASFQRDGAKVYLHEDDIPLLRGSGNLAAMFGATLQAFEPDVVLHDGDVIEFGGEKISVMSTPGHTDGSVCYIWGDVIFSGDTLFCMSVGRTDFPTGSGIKLRHSLQKLFALKRDYKILPGHDAPTSLSFERKNNPYA